MLLYYLPVYYEKGLIATLSFCAGFTLDKESNTIAIICQDVTVVLAFDTRERLIQWQVKISSNLGDGEKTFMFQNVF